MTGLTNISKAARLNLRVTCDERQALEVIADRERCGLTAVATAALREYITRHGLPAERSTPQDDDRRPGEETAFEGVKQLQHHHCQEGGASK